MAKPQTTAEARAKTIKDEGKYWGVDANNQRIYWAREARRASRRGLKRRLMKEQE